MSAAGFRGRGSGPRARRIRGGLLSGVVAAQIPQPNFNQPRRGENHGPPTEFWHDHSSLIPWQQMNGPPPPQQFSNFESHRYRGRPQFCPKLSPRGRSKKVRGKGRPRPAILTPPDFGATGLAEPESETHRFPPLGSEEERQQKIAETADKLKQKLSSLNIGKPAHCWEDNSSSISFSQNEDHLIASKGIPDLRHDPPELNLTVNDFKDIGRVDPDCVFISIDSVEGFTCEKSSSKVPAAQENSNDPKHWPQPDHRDHKNSSDKANKPKKTFHNNVEVDTVNRSNEIINETIVEYRRKSVPKSKLSDKPLPSVLKEKSAEVAEKKSNRELMPELNKSLEKLREVINVERKLDKEGKSSVSTESRTIIQLNTGSRLQPDPRPDFQTGYEPGYSKFHTFDNCAEPQETKNRYQSSFRPEHLMPSEQNFTPDFSPRFDHRPDADLRNFNLSRRPPDPRMIHSEFHGATSSRMQNRNSDLHLRFDPREPPPRFNGPIRQDYLTNDNWFNRNELSQQFGPPSNLNGLQPSLSFDPRGLPPRFINQDQEMPIFDPNIISSSNANTDFPQIVPMGYPQVPHMHMEHRTEYFQPRMPPPNTASCILHKFPPSSVPQASAMDSQTLQPPPMPTGALDIQSHTIPHTPFASNLPQELNELRFSSGNQNPTPNMNDELEDMQEALEFAKKLMSMTEEEDNLVQEFDMPTFPDLPPIPSTELSHLAEKPPAHNSGNLPEANTRSDGECGVIRDELGVAVRPPISVNKTVRREVHKELLVEQLRPKVAFNLYSKNKRILQVEEWRQQNDKRVSREKRSRGKISNFLNSESLSKERCETKLQESRHGRKNRLHSRVEREKSQNSGKNLTRKENRIENTIEIGNNIFEDSTKGRVLSSKASSKSLAASTVDANWKDKVINQFLKMSKNDICNMVNSSSLRKFDIAMKHLVKEQKSSLAQERRCSADDAVKGTSSYDMSREEFMSQLSAMLDPSATVDVKNLPSKFIQHLSEVLKLDVQLHLTETADLIEGNNMPENLDNTDPNEDNHSFFSTCEPQSFTDSLNDLNFVPNYSADGDFGMNVKTESEPTQKMQMPGDFGYSFTDSDNENNSLREMLPNMAAIDDIFSLGIARVAETQKSVPQGELSDERSKEIEGEFIAHGLIRARCTRTLMSDQNIDLADSITGEVARSAKNTEGKKTVSSAEQYQTKIEGIEGWGKKTRQDPGMFRNLTKEEWEARCIKSMECFTEKESETRSKTSSSRDTSLSNRSHSPRHKDRTFESQRSSRNLSPPSPLTEKNCNLKIAVYTANDAAEKWSNATDDENSLIKSNSARVSSISSGSDHPASPNISNSQKMLIAREYKACSSTLDLETDFVSQYTSQQLAKDVMPAKNPYQKFESKKTRNISSNMAIMQKSRVKKIDIQAYKARKLQRNTQQCNKLRELEASPDLLSVHSLNIPWSGEKVQEPAQEIPKTTISRVARFRSKDKCEKIDSLEESKNDSLLAAQDFSTPSLHKEKNTAPILMFGRRGKKKQEKKPSKKTSTKGDKKYEKVNSNDKPTKDRLRFYSRKRGRSTSQEDSWRTNKEKSKHFSQKKQHDGLRSVSVDKAYAKPLHQTNNILESRDRKITRREACSLKDEHQRIEKCHSWSKKNFAEESPKNKETENRSDSRGQSCGLNSESKANDRGKDQEADSAINENYDSLKETANVEQKHKKELTCLAETNDVLSENLEKALKEPNITIQSSEKISKDMQTEDCISVVPSEIENTSLGYGKTPPLELETETASSENGLHMEVVTGTDSNAIEVRLAQNEIREFSAPEEKKVKSNILKDTENELKNESWLDETITRQNDVQLTDTSANHEAENTLKLLINVEPKQPCQNDIIKLMLNDLIDKAISQLDLLGVKHEAKETIDEIVAAQEPINCRKNDGASEPELFTENDQDFQESTEYNTLEFNSPETLQSPLKGISEESINTSMLGKRKLTESVLEITKDYTSNKKAKNCDNVGLDIGIKVLEHHSEPIQEQKSEEIDSRSRIIRIDGLEKNVYPEESASKIVRDETRMGCITPSGDTLSLGSSIDFDNGEFIVLSEISSDEDFSLDEGHKSESHELVDIVKQDNERESKTKAKEKEATLSKDKDRANQTETRSRKLQGTKSSKNTDHTKSKETHSEFKNLAEQLSVTHKNAEPQASKNSSHSSELDVRPTPDALDEDPVDNVLQEYCRVAMKEYMSQPSAELAHNLNSEMISMKNAIIAKDKNEQKISECKRPSKLDEVKNIDAMNKDILSNENSINKNLHKVRHKSRLKHKKEKKFKLGEKHVKEGIRSADVVTSVRKQHTKENVIARMVEIDLEIHKLMSEKMKLYQMLECGDLPIEQSLTIAKTGPELISNTENKTQQEPESYILNNKNSETPIKQKSSRSMLGTEPAHLKSSTTIAGCSSENNIDNQHNGHQRDIGFKDSKKTHKHERLSRPDNIIQNESRRLSAERALEAKSLSLRSKNTEDKSTSKKDNYSRSSSTSNRYKEEKEEHTRKNIGPTKETADETVDIATISQKSKKAEHHNIPRKKANKPTDSKDDPLRRVKKEIQNDELELRCSTTSKSPNVGPEKQTLKIDSDVSSQVSVSQECSRSKRTPRGLTMLKKSPNQEKAVSKCKTALCKERNRRLRSLQKSISALSPSEEEMPLNLLYFKKFQKKRELSNMNIKPTTSIKVLEHVLETINAVAENKTDIYQTLNKIEIEVEENVTVDMINLNQRAKARGKTTDNTSNLNVTDQSQGIGPIENISGGKSLLENLPIYNCRDLNDSNNAEDVINSRSETNDKLPLDNIIEISRKNNGTEMEESKCKAKKVTSTGETQQLLPNLCEREVNKSIEGEHGRIPCQQWNSENVQRLSVSESQMLNCSDKISLFDESDSTSMLQVPTLHGHSTICNFKDIEKELDILDSVLETVSNDLEGISPKDTSSFVKTGKRKCDVSTDNTGIGDVTFIKKIALTGSKIKNCSVRLVDCKYTYLKNPLNSRTAQRCTTFSAKKTNNLLQSDISSPISRNITESYIETPKSESPVSLQLVDENQPPACDGHYSTVKSDCSLNDIIGRSKYDEDIFEDVKSRSSSHGAEDIVNAYSLSAILSKTGNWQLLNKLQAEEVVDLETESTKSSRLSLDCPATEITILKRVEDKLRTKTSSQLIDPEGHKEAHKFDQTKERILASEISVAGKKEAVDKCSNNIQVVNFPSSLENEVREVELPRIQYSVHKGPILDIKVFNDSILAASEDGIIYRYSQTYNGILNTYEGHQSAVTCIHVMQGVMSSGIPRDWLFSGSLDGSLRCFDIMTSYQVRSTAEVGSSVQCMDQAWGMIFLGTKSGYVFRFHIKSHAFKGEEIKFSEESVLALKATTEGPRRVLIVASRSQPITIRDAQSGLFLRTVSGHKNHTVYSLLMNNNLVYCGTSSTAIPVFDFINGCQIKLYNAGPGIVCMRMYKWLLFAGCYDGNIYVFDTKEQRLVCSISGPGNMLLSMDIVESKIVAGSKDRRLHMWQMPEQVLTILAGRRT